MRLFGASKNHRVVISTHIWPIYENLKWNDMEQFEQESLMRDVKITQVEWTAVDTICSLRFTFNNGTSSIQMGDKLELRKVFVFSKDSEIQKVAISVRGQQEYLEAITFWDKNGTELISIRGDNVNGVTHTLNLGKYQHINGV